jgi:hypothetical protein
VLPPDTSCLERWRGEATAMAQADLQSEPWTWRTVVARDRAIGVPAKSAE